MLSSKYRFHSRGGVKYTYRNGKNIRTAKISLVYNQNIKNKQRFAVVVSKKVMKSAVGRNRIRRRIYEAIRFNLDKLDKPFDCIFVVYSSDFISMPFSDIYDTISGLFKQIVIK